MILEHIQSPADVKSLEREQLPQLCQELREFLVQHVSETGGHLASNLGAVELTVAHPSRLRYSGRPSRF